MIVKNWIKISIALLIEFYELIELYGDAYQESSQWAETFFFICDFCHKNKDIGKKEQSQKDDSLILLNNQFYHNSPCSQKHKNGRNDELKLYRYVLFIHFFFLLFVLFFKFVLFSCGFLCLLITYHLNISGEEVTFQAWYLKIVLKNGDVFRKN